MGPSAQLDDSTLESFNERVPGAVLHSADDGYDETRSVWNAKINTEPAIIVQCRGTADVITAVEFTRDQDLVLAVNDSDAKTVQVQGGATWDDLSHQLHAFDLEIIGMPYVGVDGVTLGGGMGLLSRKYGGAIDNLRSVDAVTADGELIQTSGDEHPDLFWALRGRSGNFGVVTSFEFDCHEEQPEALQGMFLHPIEDAMDVIRFYRELIVDPPEEVVAGTGIFQIPADRQHPSELHGPGRSTDG